MSFHAVCQDAECSPIDSCCVISAICVFVMENKAGPSSKCGDSIISPGVVELPVITAVLYPHPQHGGDAYLYPLSDAVKSYIM